MKTKTTLLTAGLMILTTVLTMWYANAQVPFQGLRADHEGIAVWNADGSGPEPAATGHDHPFGWGSSRYYCASSDYDGIDPDSTAAMGHLLDAIEGFPLFVQALNDQGFTPEQVKLKFSVMSSGNDLEGEDWFTFSDMHYFNRYDGYYFLELNGEPMISGYLCFSFVTYDETIYNRWQSETNFTRPVDASASSSAAVQSVADAFMQDMIGRELRMIFEDMQSTGIFFSGNGRVDGLFLDIVSGYLEKGMPELPFAGPATDHEGFACWDADGSGPEPQAGGHTFLYNGITWWMSYYVASRDYDGIDPEPGAAMSHLLEGSKGFPNTMVQLDYRGYSQNEMKIKSGISTLGNDIEGVDWGLNGSIHWYNFYGNTVTLEIAGEPILAYVIDTSFGSIDLGSPGLNWESISTKSTLRDVSDDASDDARHVAVSFMKDLAGHSMKSHMTGHSVAGVINTNGRSGVFHEISAGAITPELPSGTLIWDREVSGTWDLAGSPYVVMGRLLIPDGDTLTIDPGVQVQFNTTERFDVQGCLLAEGTAQLPILFTSYDNDVRWGGMVWDQTPSSNAPTKLRYCIFEYAYAYGPEQGYNCGGAIRINMFNNMEISHCIFRHNLADRFLATNNPTGGALFMYECSIPISHCIFHDNAASWGGALAVCSNSNPVIDNCLFYNNESTYAEGGGGAVLSWTTSNPFYINCTFADNHSAEHGGAAELEFGGKTAFTNCLFWGNTADAGVNQISIFDPENSILNIYHCDVEEGLSGIEPGFVGDTLHILNVDPEFTGTGDFPYALNSSSSCVDEGTLDALYLPSGWSCPSNCLCGNPRVIGTGIDMGCYEVLQTGSVDSPRENLFSYNVYPNPVNTRLTLELYLEEPGPVWMTMLDIRGCLVLERLIPTMPAGNNKVVIDAGNLAAGVYFCQIQHGKSMITQKVVKIKQ